MTENFRKLIDQLNDEELSNYFFELAKYNDIQKINDFISSEYYWSSLHILMCSFDFHKTKKGLQYWQEMVHRIRINNQKNK
jgi:hypothetical protein